MRTFYTIIMMIIFQNAWAQQDTIQLMETHNKVYIWVEEQPYPNFPGCDTAVNKTNLVNCQQKKLQRFLESNLKNPEPGSECVVKISFIIGTDGSLSEFEVYKAPSPAFEVEAIRVAKLLPRWTPGKQAGKLVKIQYSLPVKFKRVK